jgi:excisionase family DNA binding protein
MRQETRTIGVRETARKLNVTITYVYSLLYSGKLPAEKLARQWSIPLSAVESWLKKRGQ